MNRILSKRLLLSLIMLGANPCASIEQQWQLDSGIDFRDGNEYLDRTERISLRYNVTSSLSHGHIDLHYQLGNNMALVEDTGDYNYRISDLDQTILDDDISQNLDRLLYRYYWENTDITIGRQAISLGNARFSSNVDIFDPSLIGALQTDYRAGVDAIRFEHMTEMDERGLTLLDGAWLGDSQGYARIRSNIQQTDIHFTYVGVNDLTARSLAFDSAVDELGVWMVINQLADRESTLLVMQLGMDFSWYDFLYQIEVSQRESTDIALLSELIQTRMLPYGDKQYVFASASYLSGVRSQFQVALAHNSRINSQLWSARYQYVINDQWDAWLQVNTHDGLYESSSVDAFSFQHAGHLISVNVKGVF